MSIGVELCIVVSLSDSRDVDRGLLRVVSVDSLRVLFQVALTGVVEQLEPFVSDPVHSDVCFMFSCVP